MNDMTAGGGNGRVVYDAVTEIAEVPFDVIDDLGSGFVRYEFADDTVVYIPFDQLPLTARRYRVTVTEVEPEGATIHLMGLTEIAKHTGLSRQTVDTWHHRGKLPEPDWIIPSRPIWQAETIHAWWAETNGWPLYQRNPVRWSATQRKERGG